MSGDRPADGLVPGADGRPRCFWHGGLPDYEAYHDTEWGWPVDSDTRLFEKICLEGFQSGLSWLTILRKRENFRAAFDGFDFHKVSLYGPDEIDRLLADAGIVRHRGKIEATINNAARAVEMVAESGSLSRFFWAHVPPASERPEPVTYDALMANPTTDASKRLSKDLKKRGWKFVGPTTAYAFMQAMGLVNDHLEGCCVRAPVEAARQVFLKDRAR
ncbi:MAG: DNA-3-methyladenine glycosylase I [Minwuia sp.]|nr:DNA-3-methyladenine glycosylase I [Minwuia sp.]